MDIIFDIDGTLADAAHRLHFILDPSKPKDWENFLSDDQVAGDVPIFQMWELITSLTAAGNQILFITGRPESQRSITWNWLTRATQCGHRRRVNDLWSRLSLDDRPVLLMRETGDRRPSSIVKQELLHTARTMGFRPTMVFEDRQDDTAMWRRNGLLCCQVAEGNY